MNAAKFVAVTAVALMFAMSAGCSGSSTSGDATPPTVERVTPSRLRFVAPAYLSLRARTWPPLGGPYDRAYWTISLHCDPFQSASPGGFWKTTLHEHLDAGPVPAGSEWGSPPEGDFRADMKVSQATIAAYLRWSDETVVIDRERGRVRHRTPGREQFDVAEGQAVRLDVEFVPASTVTFSQGEPGIRLPPPSLLPPSTQPSRP